MIKIETKVDRNEDNIQDVYVDVNTDNLSLGECLAIITEMVKTIKKEFNVEYDDIQKIVKSSIEK